MNLKKLSPEEFTNIYNTHMIQDFPDAELKPLKRILYTMSKGLSHCFGLYENNELKGYSVFIIPQTGEYGLLDYLAITRGNRGKNYGHKFFECIKDFFIDSFPKLKGFFIECENIDRAENEAEKNIRTRRISFYKNNCCLETSLGSELFGVEYSILYYPVISDCLPENGFKALDFIYRKMFTKKHYDSRVKLWGKISDDTLSMPATKLAPYLIGKLLCRNINGTIIKYRITETECYFGEEDTACHANKGKTDRTKTLYEKGGTSYVYLCYGMHNLFNVVSGPEEHPEAVLIRGVEGFDGPGKLTKALSIDRSLNGIDMGCSSELWLEDDGTKPKYRRDKRIGIDYATPKYRNILWRFIAL